MAEEGLIGFDQEIPDRAVKTSILGEAETAARFGVKTRVWRLGLRDAILSSWGFPHGHWPPAVRLEFYVSLPLFPTVLSPAPARFFPFTYLLR